VPNQNILATPDARLRFLEEKIHLGTWTYDLEKSLMSWSQGMFRLLGLEPNVVIADVDLERSLVHPDDRASFDQSLVVGVARAPQRQLYRVIRPDGTMRWLLSKSQVHFTREGSANMMFGVTVDVTEDQENTEKFRIQQSYVKLLKMFLSGNTWITDNNGKLLDHAHWHFLTSINITTENDWSQRIHAIHPDDRDVYGQAWIEALTNRSSYSSKFRIRRPDGNYEPMISRGLPVFDDNGILIYWVGHSAIDAGSRNEHVTGGVQHVSGSHVRAGRAFLNWSAQELAQRAGIPFASVRKIESAGAVKDQRNLATILTLFKQNGVAIVDRLDGAVVIETGQ
jgi:PAS domain S-box-containing protein